MPGVRSAQPAIAAAIKRHQPFNQEWMRWLDQLRNAHTHNGPTKRVRKEEHRADVPNAWGTRAKFTDARSINGREVTASEFFDSPVDEQTIYDWVFPGIGPPVPEVLNEIQAKLMGVVSDVSTTAKFLSDS